QHRRGTTRNLRSRDHDIGFANELREVLVLTTLRLFGDLLRVATTAFGFAELHTHPLRTQALDLLLHRRAYVETLHDRAESPRRSDRLEPRHSCTEHEHARRRNGACRGHEHREEAVMA